MVKVLKCHHFKSQNVVPVDGEPVAVFACQKWVFVATEDFLIEVFQEDDKESKYSKLSSFNTEAPVLQILFNSTGKYIVTLECKTSRKQEFYSVRVYLNWQHGTKQKTQGLIVRPAGSTHGVRASTIDSQQLQVIDIPCKSKVNSISTCQQTGNVAIATGEITRVYHLVEKTLANTDKTYYDVILFLQLHWGFTIEKVCICEEYISVLSEEQAQVIRVLYADKQEITSEYSGRKSHSADNLRNFGRRSSSIAARRLSSAANVSLWSGHSSTSSIPTVSGLDKTVKRESRSSVTASPALSNSSLTKSTNTDTCNNIQDDEHFVQWNFEDLGEAEVFADRKSGSKEVPKTIFLKNLEEFSNRDLLLADTPEVQDLRGGGHMTMGEVYVVNVLYKRRVLNDSEWKFMQLLPVYMSKSHFGLQYLPGGTPLHSSSHSGLIGMCCLFSGVTEGYLYNVWSQAQRLSTYKYTSEARQIVLDGDLLYIITQTGLETYTARCSAAAIHNTEMFNNVNKAFPPADLDICLCGVHPFMVAREITVTDKHVILLSKVGDSARKTKTDWSLYAIEKCSVADLYKDMFTFGIKYQETSTATYHHLMLESHMILRGALIGCEKDKDQIQDLLHESCALLGEFYAMPDCDNWRLALPYYVMSGLNIAQVVRQVIQYKQHTKMTTPYCFGKGFLHYLKSVLFSDDEPCHIKEDEGDLVLEVCSEAIPHKLSGVILLSNLQTYNAEKAMTLLQSWLKQKSSAQESASAEDLLAMAILHLKLCEPESAQSSLNLVNKKELTDICTSNHQLLHQDFQQLSPLSQLMRCHWPEVLIQSLTILHDTGTISLDLAIKLLQGPSGHEDIYKNTHVKEYLELLVNSSHRRYIFEDAVSILSKIYVKRMLQPIPPGSRSFTSPPQVNLPKGDGHFTKRPTWLDYLPPFSGPSSIKGPCQFMITAPNIGRRSNQSAMKQKPKDVCPCFLCNEDLMKLQSLLCYPDIQGTIVDKVLHLLEENTTELKGHDSLWLLCTLKKDRPTAVEFMVDKYPCIIIEYRNTEDNSSTALSQELLEVVLKAVRQQTENSDEREKMYMESLTDILKQLACKMDPESFMNILPDDGSFSFFLPFISLSYENQQSSHLLSEIIGKGKQLQRMF